VNACAVASFVLSALWIPLVGNIAAVVLGHIALRQLRTSRQSGRVFAILGLVLGYVELAFTAVLLVTFVVGQLPQNA
jgi:hypothetical protein